jgi:hypothetical protein
MTETEYHILMVVAPITQMRRMAQDSNGSLQTSAGPEGTSASHRKADVSSGFRFAATFNRLRRLLVR